MFKYKQALLMVLQFIQCIQGVPGLLEQTLGEVGDIVRIHICMATLGWTRNEKLV